MQLDNPAHNPPVPFMSRLVCPSDIRSYAVVSEKFSSLAYSSILIPGLPAKSLSIFYCLSHSSWVFGIWYSSHYYKTLPKPGLVYKPPWIIWQATFDLLFLLVCYAFGLVCDVATLLQIWKGKYCHGRRLWINFDSYTCDAISLYKRKSFDGTRYDMAG